MSIRLTIDGDFKVHDIEAVTDYSPFTICPNVTPNFKRMIGAEIKLGWTLQVRKALGGVEGCTHLVDLLIAMATVAFQTLYRSEEHTSELQSLMRISYAVFCLKQKNKNTLHRKNQPVSNVR